MSSHFGSRCQASHAALAGLLCPPGPGLPGSEAHWRGSVTGLPGAASPGARTTPPPPGVAASRRLQAALTRGPRRVGGFPEPPPGLPGTGLSPWLTGLKGDSYRSLRAAVPSLGPGRARGRRGLPLPPPPSRWAEVIVPRGQASGDERGGRRKLPGRAGPSRRRTRTRSRMGKQKKARKYAIVKRMINLRDQRIKQTERAKSNVKKKDDPSAIKEREVPQHPSCLFFQYNMQLGPPYYILIDTNFINFSIKAKLDLVQSMMDCLYAKCIPCITDCVMAEIEKLGQKYRVALRIAKDPRFERLPCTHKGTYADDCLVQRVTQHKCYIVATVDRDLKRRIRKIPGVPIMYISNHRYNIERMPDDYGAPRF
ncbi:rRNA-processing protein FCF1 homolog isoform X1 [Dermochelys coriacea]|nr:rRNA-processing protein FCF1 homolog isoform X1 [Dermochelys coriacea]